MTNAVFGWDATGANLAQAPDGQGATYTTGSGGIAATAKQIADHPGIVRICQDAGGTDATADVIDDEPGADSDTGSVAWFRKALESYRSGVRPGQRYPCFYRDRSGLPTLRAAVEAAGLETPVPLWLAWPGLTMSEAAAMLHSITGPFIITGIQFADRGLYDSDVWSESWLSDVSTGPGPVTTPAPPSWTEVIMQNLPELKPGDKGPAVRTAQALLRARYTDIGTTGSAHDGIDGDFGPLTESAVKDIQGKAKITIDGIIGPETWPVLAGI